MDTGKMLHKFTHTVMYELLDAMLAEGDLLTEKGVAFAAKKLSDLKPLSEMDKLEMYLSSKGMSYERKPLHDGEQIVCGNWDAVCHSFSYGNEAGLLETMGMPDDNGDVTGWLTADDIISRLEGKGC